MQYYSTVLGHAIIPNKKLNEKKCWTTQIDWVQFRKIYRAWESYGDREPENWKSWRQVPRKAKARIGRRTLEEEEEEEEEEEQQQQQQQCD